MRFKKALTYTIPVLLFIILFSGSVRSDIYIPTSLEATYSTPVSAIETPPPETTTTTTASTTASVTTTSPTTVTTSPAATTPPTFNGQPSPRDAEYESQLAFVGDSVCMGLKVYGGLLSPDQVFAQGSVSARTIYDYTFSYKGQALSIIDCIRLSAPKYIYIWMGINDINITEADVYAKNLEALANNFLAVSPESKIAIVSMTPTTTSHRWQANGRINDYNAYVKNYFAGLDNTKFYYIDVHSALVNSAGALPDNLHSGDGLHLGTAAYQIVLGYISANKIK